MRSWWVGFAILLLVAGCRNNVGPEPNPDALLSWEAQGLEGETVFSLVSDLQGRLFAVTETGLHRRDPGNPDWAGVSALGSSVWAVARFPQGWVASSRSGVYVSASDGQDWVRRHTQDNVLALVYTTAGEVIGSTSDGSMMRSSDTENWLMEQVSPNANLELVASGQGGNMYAASVRDGVFRRLDTEWGPVLENEQVYALLGGGIEQVYAGTWTSGVMRSTNAGATWTSLGLDELKVRSLLRLPDGGLLAGTMESGLYRLFPDDEDWTLENNGLPDAPVFALARDTDGHLWVGFEGEGVYRSTTPLVFP